MVSAVALSATSPWHAVMPNAAVAIAATPINHFTLVLITIVAPSGVQLVRKRCNAQALVKCTYAGNTNAIVCITTATCCDVAGVATPANRKGVAAAVAGSLP